MVANNLDKEMSKLILNRYSEDEPGGAIMIAKGDDILYEYYEGQADLSTKEPINKDTRFNIASVSKQFTAISVLLLQDRKLLSINDHLTNYLPNLNPEVFGNVTLAHLMSHSSGIPDERPRTDRKWMLAVTDEQSIEYLYDVKNLHFNPGTQYEYINPTFQILYAIIEKLSGKSFVDFQQQNIFDKAAMNSTFYFDASKKHAHVSHGYVMENQAESMDRDAVKEPVYINDAIVDKQGHRWHEYDYGEETFFATKADGGIYSTLRDLLSWHRALKNNSIVSKSAIEEAYNPHILVSGSKYSDYQNRPYTSYGLGFFIDTTPNYPMKIYHTGDNGGYQSYLAYFPEKDVSVIILENRNDNDRWSLVKKIDALLQANGII